jgi:chromosome segregation ATPase
VRGLERRVTAVETSREQLAQQVDHDAMCKQRTTDDLVRQQAATRSEIVRLRAVLEAGADTVDGVEAAVLDLQRNLDSSDKELERVRACCAANAQRDEALREECDRADQQLGLLETELRAILGNEGRLRGELDQVIEDTDIALNAIDALRQSAAASASTTLSADGEVVNARVVEQIERETKSAVTLKHKLDADALAKQRQVEHLEDQLHVLVQEQTNIERKTDQLRETAAVLEEAVAERQATELIKDLQPHKGAQELTRLQQEVEGELGAIDEAQAQLRHAEQEADVMRREVLKERLSGEAAHDVLVAMQARAAQLELDVEHASKAVKARVLVKQAESEFLWDTLRRAVVHERQDDDDHDQDQDQDQGDKVAAAVCKS